MFGILGVYIGAEWLVKGSSNLSRDLGIKPIIIGLTVVAFGTSTPELAVSLTAAIKGSNDISVGNIIGSNIANIGLILGISAMILPLKVEKIIMKNQLPLMIAISFGFYFMAIDREIGFVDGLFLFIGIIIFTGYQIYNTINSKTKSHNQIHDKDKNSPDLLKSPLLSDKTSSSLLCESTESNVETTKKNLLKNILYIMIGLTSLLIGAHLFVKSAIFLANRLGISEMVIGITMVAVGTSIPEMATSVVSAFRKEADICVGNIVGSNIFNILMVIGAVGLISPINVPQETINFELPVMLLFSIALIPMIRGSLYVNRIEGFILTLGYFVFIFSLFR